MKRLVCELLRELVGEQFCENEGEGPYRVLTESFESAVHASVNR